MKKIIFTICFYVIPFGMFSQTENVISNGGSYNENSNGSLTWTIGEVVISSLKSPNEELVQGFNHDWLNFLSIEKYSEKINIFVFPNPTTQFITVNTSKKTDLNIFNIAGELLKSVSVKDNDKIDLKELSAGIYFLEFNRGSQKVETIKIIIQ